MSMLLSQDEMIAINPPLTAPTDPHFLVQPGQVSDPLPISYVNQGSFQNLCWAACCQMVMAYNHIPVRDLCEITTRVFNNPQCCSSPFNCDQTEWPYVAFPRLQFSCTPYGDTLEFDKLAREILVFQRPAELLVQWDAGNTHVVLVTGAWSDRTLQVLDPAVGGGMGPKSYDDVLNAGGYGRWIDTYYNLQPSGPPLANA